MLDIDNLTVANLPHSILMIGERGGMQNEICNELAAHFGMQCIDITNNITKEYIDQVFLSPNPSFYVINITEIDYRRQNMMLKLFEEPGPFTFIILIAENIDDVIDTIYNRSYVIKLKSYTREELEPYVIKDKDLVLDLCSTPGQVEIANHTDIKALYKLCETIISSMKNANYANALSIADKINYKDEYDKFDLYLFIKAFSNLLLSKLRLNYDKLCYNYLMITKDLNSKVWRVNNKKQQVEYFITNLWEAARCL